MTTAAERLRAAIHLESAAIAPQTSPLIEAAKEVLNEIERMGAALRECATDCYLDEYDLEFRLTRVAQVARAALADNQQGLHNGG